MRWKLICSIVSHLTVLGGLMMIFPALTDWFLKNDHSALIFSLCSALTVIIGLIGWLIADAKQAPLKVKEMFLTTTLIWFVFTFICAMPIYFSLQDISLTDAFFEASSGLTTTGATVFTNLEDLPAGLLIWRSMMQWMGGLGILVIAILVLPALQIGGMQLFNIETSGESNRDMPTAAQNVAGILLYFISLTVICAGCLSAAGMSLFDAINHALTTVATGGFSTHNQSIAYYHSPLIEWILTCFMFLGGLPLMLGILLFRRHFDSIRENEQIKLYCLSFLGFVLFFVTVRWYDCDFDSQAFGTILRTSAFQVISIMTSTGYTVDDFEMWGAFATIVFLLIMLTGACTGSTSGGIKMFRYTILFKAIQTRLKKSVQPHGIFITRYGNKPITDDVVGGVLVFFGLYALSAAVGAVLLSLYNLDFITAISGAVSALSNIGPGLGSVIGPASTYAELPDTPKSILSVMMIIGRLEFVAVYILLLPFFWKKNI